MKTKAPSGEGRFAYEGLDRVIHERARLSVLTSLISSPKGVTFGELKRLCSLTDGNLSRHLRVLERPRPQSSADGLPHFSLRPQALSRIPLHPRAGGARCGKGNEGRADARTGTRTGASTGLNFFVIELCSAKLIPHGES